MSEKITIMEETIYEWECPNCGEMNDAGVDDPRKAGIVQISCGKCDMYFDASQFE